MNYPFNDFIHSVNMLIEQDRTEIRAIKNRLFNISQYVILGFIASFALCYGTDIKSDDLTLLWLLIIGCGILLVYYIFLYIFYIIQLRNTRKCLLLRELFIEDHNEFKNRGLSPLGDYTKIAYKGFRESEPPIYLVTVVCFAIFTFVSISLKISDFLCVCT